MGNVQVQYKQRRGANEPGSEVTDPKDWFENIIEEQFDAMKPMYDALPGDKKSSFQSIFDDTDVMNSKASFQMWFNENSEDTEYMGQAKSQLQAFMSENQ